MVVSDIRLYEVLTDKFGREEARAIAEYVEAKSEKQLADKLVVFATKEDLFGTKESLKAEIASVRLEMRGMEVRITRNIFIAGVVQFLAMGSVLMLLKFHAN